ncbi:N-carbamoyl-L-amino acid amidohydrolase [Aurantimonas sp. DM33-3]|uniref:N-carbamoyl-L-amino acid amidohydrolase n=1 Tax=Aurantimonas sp. DM33-3 TaxID=2766955 RepID=UPI001651B4ED|nr:N-carbamoyl-L-amino acid amidohydrolase [Aurantimonas sp. DM33-3]MBC6716835.1 N-carbamoyl-L-amino acid amidohydrolase [Aurantimonas sp. DM33-3]
MDKRSAYLVDGRLSDVIAAIQTMGTYKSYKMSPACWADRINGDKSQSEHWVRVFEDHPEFFRFDSARKRVSLVVRRQRPKRFDLLKEATITREEFYSYTDEKKNQVSRLPLNSSECETLMDIAISLHRNAVEEKRDRRWWIPLVMSLVGASIGAVAAFLAAMIGSQ